jgi:hypothetical protein
MELSKQKSRKIIHLSKRDRKLAAAKLFPKVLQETEVASLNICDDSSGDDDDDNNNDECENTARNSVQGYLHFFVLTKTKQLNLIQIHLICLGGCCIQQIQASYKLC